MNNKYIFLILSNQQFDFLLPTNKWHVANTLSKMGHKVIFVDPPVRIKGIKGLFKKTINHSENLKIYRPINSFNFKPFSNLNLWIHTKIIKSLINNIRSEDEKLILWIYHFDFPDLEKFSQNINYDAMIYDCVDEYTAFPEYVNSKKVTMNPLSIFDWIDNKLKIVLNQNGMKGKGWVLHREKWLAEKSDLLFVSAPGLLSKFKKWRKQVDYLPNAAAVEKFDIEKNSIIEPNDIKDIPHPRIGFTGAIDTYKNDLKLIEMCAKKNPDYEFIIIGPERVADPDLDLSTLKKFSNVHFLGEKKWELTPSYFVNFDVYFIPYNLNDYTVGGCFPVKYFEALAAGLPTVVTNLPAYQGFDVDGYVSKNDDEFIKNIKKAIDGNSEKRIKARKELARKNSYNGKVKKELNLIEDYFDNVKSD